MSTSEQWEREALELRAKLAMEREKLMGFEDRLQKTARQNAWLVVLLGTDPAQTPHLVAKLREEDPALASTIDDPLAVAAFRATLKLD